MREIRKIIVHCTASRFGDRAEVDRWHKERGFKVVHKGVTYHIGYHALVLNGYQKAGWPYDDEYDGVVVAGRPEDVIGAHCKGHNHDSLGICYVGNPPVDKPLDLNGPVWKALIHKIVKWCGKYGLGPGDVYGHCELDSKKPDCPGLDMNELRRDVDVELYRDDAG